VAGIIAIGQYLDASTSALDSALAGHRATLTRHKIIRVPPGGTLLYGELVRVERHWWNGNRTGYGRRDVYIRTDGELWEVEAQAGGSSGRSTVQQCPGQASAVILARAWLGGRAEWREMVP
jgi:hypothetical protein